MTQLTSAQKVQIARTNFELAAQHLLNVVQNHPNNAAAQYRAIERFHGLEKILIAAEDELRKSNWTSYAIYRFAIFIRKYLARLARSTKPVKQWLVKLINTRGVK